MSRMFWWVAEEVFFPLLLTLGVSLAIFSCGWTAVKSFATESYGEAVSNGAVMLFGICAYLWSAVAWIKDRKIRRDYRDVAN